MIIALYGLGMRDEDILSHLEEMYGLEVSSRVLAAVTGKILHTVKEWQPRPLESLHPILGIIYTTKTKEAFPTEDSLLKLLYLRIQNASKKWTMPIHNWSLTIFQSAIFFE